MWPGPTLASDIRAARASERLVRYLNETARREQGLGMSTRSFAFSVVLATYLTGLALGAALSARWVERLRDPAFPAVRLIVGEARGGRDVGALVAMNTLGGIAGTLLTGFVLVPRLGLIRTLGALAIAAGVVGVAALSSPGWPRSPQRCRGGH